MSTEHSADTLTVVISVERRSRFLSRTNSSTRTAVDETSGTKPIAQVAPIRGTAAAHAPRHRMPNAERVVHRGRARLTVPVDDYNLSIVDTARWSLIVDGKVSGIASERITISGK